MSKVEAGVPHRYGPYGGQYVPETLMPALAELEAQWIATRDDPGYRAELEVLLRDYCGRPTPLYLAERLSDVQDEIQPMVAALRAGTALGRSSAPDDLERLRDRLFTEWTF